MRPEMTGYTDQVYHVNHLEEYSDLTTKLAGHKKK